MLYGFVATLAKVVIDRDCCNGELRVADLPLRRRPPRRGGARRLLRAERVLLGPPDLVIAGLTVIDPLVAVSIGIVVLARRPMRRSGPSSSVVAAAIAVYGVFQLAKTSPAGGRRAGGASRRWAAPE